MAEEQHPLNILADAQANAAVNNNNAAPPANNGAQGNPPGYQAQHFPPVQNNQPAFVPAQFPPQPPPPANPNGPGPQQQPIYVHQYPPVRYMPSRYDRNALKFDGKPTSLRRFFEDIEALANDCVLSQREKITHTLRYLETDDHDAWSSQPSAQGNDWELFKREITAMYPGSEDNARFSATDLELFVEHHTATPMQDRFQFGEYYRGFLTKSGWLLNRNIISHRERNKMFINGFHINFRQQLRMQLRLQDPLHPLDEPWEMNDIEQAARFLLEGSTNIIAIPTLPPPHAYTAPPPAAPTPQPRQTFDMSSIEQILTSDAFLNCLAERITLPN